MAAAASLQEGGAAVRQTKAETGYKEARIKKPRLPPGGRDFYLSMVAVWADGPQKRFGIEGLDPNSVHRRLSASLIRAGIISKRV